MDIEEPAGRPVRPGLRHADDDPGALLDRLDAGPAAEGDTPSSAR